MPTQTNLFGIREILTLAEGTLRGDGGFEKIDTAIMRLYGIQKQRKAIQDYVRELEQPS